MIFFRAVSLCVTGLLVWKAVALPMPAEDALDLELLGRRNAPTDHTLVYRRHIYTDAVNANLEAEEQYKSLAEVANLKGHHEDVQTYTDIAAQHHELADTLETSGSTGSHVSMEKEAVARKFAVHSKEMAKLAQDAYLQDVMDSDDSDVDLD